METIDFIQKNQGPSGLCLVQMLRKTRGLSADPNGNSLPQRITFKSPIPGKSVEQQNRRGLASWTSRITREAGECHDSDGLSMSAFMYDMPPSSELGLVGCRLSDDVSMKERLHRFELFFMDLLEATAAIIGQVD